jgi:chromosome segregation ATPase
VWDGNGGKVRALEAASELPLRAVFTHDDARVVATDFGGRVLAWNTADGKRLGEFDANPLPLGEQRAAVEAQIQALEPRVAQGLPALQAAEAEFAQASAQLQQAQKALDAAKAEQTAKENEVVRLKELAAQSAPPGDLQTKLTEARAVRQKARDAAAQAAEAVKAKTQLAEASKAKQAKLHAQCPAAALAEARMRLAQLKAAVINTELSRLREASGVQRRAHDRLVALAQEKRAAATQAQADAQAARAAIAQAKEKEATSTRVFETSFAEAQAAESEARKLAADLAAQDARLKEVRAAYEQAKAAAAGVQR